MVCTVPPLYKIPHLKQYRTTITLLASKQYSTYTVTIASFSCPPREATLAGRDLHCPPGIPFKLFANIYIIICMSTKQRFLSATPQYGTADIFLYDHLQHSDINGYLLRRHIHIFLCGDIYIRSVTERQFLAQPERRKDKDHQQCFQFLLFVFCFFFTVVWEQGLK